MTIAPDAITEHWCQRVRERIGEDVCPTQLANALSWAIRENRTDLVEYAGRIWRDGRRLFRFRSPDGRRFLAVVDTNQGRFVSVLAGGQRVKTHKGKTIDAEATE